MITQTQLVRRLLHALRQLDKAQDFLGYHDCFDAKELNNADDSLLRGRNVIRSILDRLDPAELQRYDRKVAERVARQAAQARASGRLPPHALTLGEIQQRLHEMGS